jgi:hypothetical protein
MPCDDSECAEYMALAEPLTRDSGLPFRAAKHVLVKSVLIAARLSLGPDVYTVKREAHKDAAILDAYAELMAAVTDEATGTWLRIFYSLSAAPKQDVMALLGRLAARC